MMFIFPFIFLIVNCLLTLANVGVTLLVTCLRGKFQCLLQKANEHVKFYLEVFFIAFQKPSLNKQVKWNVECFF